MTRMLIFYRWLPVGLIVLAMMVLFLTSDQAQAQPPPAPYLGDGDLNGDARMDEQDLLKFIQYWRQYVKNGQFTAAADFDDDGDIDHDDAAWIIGEFLRLYDVYHSGQSSASTSGVAPAQRPAAGTAVGKAKASVRASSRASNTAAGARKLPSTKSVPASAQSKKRPAISPAGDTSGA
ncbi:MAG: hypothetical protein J7M26_09870, partial [Armatimonadetes bacterium]|nr:hypothetical protein [Armatimonadota bacterium]